MNQLLDFLFLRRPKLDYISPPVCEVIFTGSGGPIITLEDLERLLGPTGFKLGGRGGHWLSWNNYPGIICFNLYFSPSGNPLGPFELINECVPPSTVLVCSAGYYRVVTHVDGEPDIMSGWSFVDGSQYQQLDLPRADGATSYDVNFAPPSAPLDADGNPETFFNVFQGVPPGGNAVETCQPGCYRITILVPLGETPPSEAQCENFVPQICFQPRIYDPIRRACVLPGDCYETLCDPGFHFDQNLCECQPNISPCTAFIDALPDFSNAFDFSDGGFTVGQGSDGFAWLYRNRVEAAMNPPLTVFGSTGTSALQMCGGGKFAAGYEFDGSFSNYAGIVIDESVPSIRDVLDNDPDTAVLNQGSMNASGDVAWPGFSAGGIEAFGKFYSYAANAFTLDIRHGSLGTVGNIRTQPTHLNDGGTVVCDVSFGSNAPSFADQVRTMRWTAGVFTDIHPGATSLEIGDSNRGWINSLGHIVAVLVNSGSGQYRPFVNLGGATFSPEGNAANIINKSGINDSDLVVWDRLGTTQVKTWDSVNGVQVLPFAGRLGPPTIGGNTNYKVLNNLGVIIGTRAAGGWVYLDGVVHNIIDLLPVGHGWTSIDEGWAISEDNYVLGKGVLGGVSQFFVAKLCL